MSFILDALRRADRERESERGGVPSLYTQAAPSPIAGTQAEGEAPRPWLWLAAGLGGGLILAAVWALWSATPAGQPDPPPGPTAAASPAEAPRAAVPPPALPPTTARSPLPPPTPTPAPEATTGGLPSRVAEAGRDPRPAEPRSGPTAADSPRAAEPAARVQQPPPAPRATVPPPPLREPEATARSEPPRTPAATPPRASADTEPASSDRLPLRQLGELTPDQRGRLPALSFGGAMYSSKAAQRRLIVNGQLLSEGDTVAPGVTLEEIRLKSAVLRTKDLRVEMGF